MNVAPDSSLTDLQQTIVDLQRQLAERAAERDEALAREAATAEVHTITFRGASAELIEALGGGEPWTLPPGSVANRLLHGESIIYTADITQDPSFDHSPRVQTLARVGGARSYIAVALRKDDRFLGFITIYRREVRPFTDKQIALLQ